ncbi:MAG: NADAR domain-containing protein [Clostridium sp.]
MAIYFYKMKDEYGCFSNFAEYEFSENGMKYKTSEHYFQSKKFEGTDAELEVINAKSPMKSAILGRDRTKPLRQDWEMIKDDVMRQAVLLKFSQNESIKTILLSTGNEDIVEKTTDDYYWGCGTDGTGKNMLGKILVEVREILK